MSIFLDDPDLLLRKTVEVVDEQVDQGITERLRTARLKQVTIDFKSPMKDAEDVYISIRLDEIGDSIMAIKKNTDV